MQGKAYITAILNPVTKETVRAEVPAGRPLRDTLDIPGGVLTEINGSEDSGQSLKDGDLVSLIIVPQGGDTGKDIARTSIVIAAMAAATAAAGPLGLTTATGSLTFGGSLFVGAVSVGATIGANALIPPSAPSGAISPDREEFTRLGAITGSRNRVLPYGTVPRVYGHRRIFPPLSARPYTEIGANHQYLRLLFNFGPGPLELSNPRIGDTLIGSFNSDNEYTSNGNFENVEIEVAESPDLYSSQVEQVDPEATLEEDSDSAIRTTSTDTEEISIDITFPQGVFAISEDGKTMSHRVDFRVEYREVGEDDWLNAYDAMESGSRSKVGFTDFPLQGINKLFRAASSKRETWRGSLSWKVDSGQYEVRVTRVETFDQEPGVDEEDREINTFDLAQWNALRSVTYESPTNLPGTVQLAMRIQATDQISGILDNFSVEAKSRLAYYDGSDWQEPTFDAATGNGTGGLITSNPAWIIADILTGSANARSIGKARLDEDSFKEFADFCDTEERECNIVLDGQRTVLQTVSLVGSTARGSLSMRDNGIYTIIQDDEQTVPIQHFTPRNSWGFTSTRVFPDVPHALRVRFTNPDADWQTDEAVVYDDGYSEDGNDCQFDDGTGVCKIATKFEVLDLEGVTSWDQAWKEGRYRLAEARLRPERYVLNADVEHIACTRGDMVLASHDVTMWGLATGRIKKIEGGTLTLDEKVPMASGKTYNIRVRNAQGESRVKTVTTDEGEQSQITVNNTLDIAAGDLFMFGETDTETQALKVFSIEPMGDLSARITLIDAAPDIYDADTGSIPEFNSNITTTETNQNPPAPVIDSVRSDGDSLYPDADSSPAMRILVSFTVGSGRPTELVEGRFRREDDDDGWTSFGTSGSGTGTLVLKDVERGGRYIIQIRARTGERTSDWVQASVHTAGEAVRVPGRPENAVGFITEDLDGSYTQIPVSLNVPLRQGYDYFIIDATERELIVITPTVENGPGEVTLAIEEQVIEAPEGSYIVPDPAQEEAESNVVPGFEFVGETLEVIGDELQATMDLIQQGATWAKVSGDAVDLVTGNVLLSATEGDLDDVQDGDSYSKVSAIAVSASGIVLLEVAEGDLDDVGDGSTYGRVRQLGLTAEGVVLVEGLSGDMDDLADGTTFQRVQSANLTAGGLVLLSASQGDIDDIANGDKFAKVDRTSVNASGIVILSGVSGDMDDLGDGSTYKRVKATNVSAGNIKIIGPDGQTVIDQGQIFTDELFASAATISDILTMGLGGVITNSGSDYRITEDGIAIEAAATDSTPRSLSFYDGEDLVGRVYANTGSNRLEIYSANSMAIRLLASFGADINLNVSGGGGIYMQTLPTSAPAESNRVWNDSGFLKIT